MAAAYRSPLAFWLGGANAPPSTTKAGFRSLLAFWLGGVTKSGTAPPAPSTVVPADAVMSKAQLDRLRKRLKTLRNLRDLDEQSRTKQEADIASLVRSVFDNFDNPQQAAIVQSLPVAVMTPSGFVEPPRIDYAELARHGEALNQIDALLKTIMRMDVAERQVASARETQRLAIARWLETQRLEFERDEEDVAMLLLAME